MTRARYAITTGTQSISISVTTPADSHTIIYAEPYLSLTSTSSNIYSVVVDYAEEEAEQLKFEIKPMMSPAERRLIKMERKIQL
jgi:hypothetical protein